MLGNIDAQPNLAVRDLQRARDFYEGVLGLENVGAAGDQVLAYKSGATTVLVYVSEFAGTNRATALTWTVGDRVEAMSGDLAAKGVVFEHYDMPGMTRTGDVHDGCGMKIAWFRDPDGNILSLVSG